MLVKRFGNVGEYFRVLKWASLKGLSLDWCGLECDWPDAEVGEELG